MIVEKNFKKTRTGNSREDLAYSSILNLTSGWTTRRFLTYIILPVLILVPPLALPAQHYRDLNTIFPKTDKDSVSFRDSSWCEMDKGTICKYAGAGWRSLLISGRGVIHIAPGPSKFEINLYPHKLIIAPNQAADIYLYARNFRLISACVLNGKAEWLHKTKVTPLLKGAGISMQGSDYFLDMTSYVYREYQNWSKGFYLYDSINLQDFASELSQKFGVRIELDDPKLKEHGIRTGIEACTSLLTALNRLCLISQLSFHVDENNTIKLRAM